MQTITLKNTRTGTTVVVAHTHIPPGEVRTLALHTFDKWCEKGGYRIMEAGLVVPVHPTAQHEATDSNDDDKHDQQNNDDDKHDQQNNDDGLAVNQQDEEPAPPVEDEEEAPPAEDETLVAEEDEAPAPPQTGRKKK